jgi:ArsR family transcriptional regulator, arsenate/arsenite/antimonite-responsive transcriptional repressor
MVGTLHADRATESVGLLKALADPIRWSVIETLGRAAGRCHCELEEDLGVGANLLSHHLRVLREVGLVTTRRRGKLVEYRLDPDGIQALRAALPAVLRSPGPDELGG